VKEVYFVKSLEEDFATKSLKGNKKLTCQTLSNIIKTKTIIPNTISFGRKRRLSCTILDKSYNKTYRPQGIIFQTDKIPDYIFPFDLVVLSAADNIIVHYYRIKNNLQLYYNHSLIKGFEKFVFKNFQTMIKSVKSPKVAWKKVNDFRRKNGYNELKKQKYRLVEYNEAVFHNRIRINPIGVVGYRKKAREVAKKLGLPCFISAKKFYQSLNK